MKYIGEFVIGNKIGKHQIWFENGKQHGVFQYWYPDGQDTLIKMIKNMVKKLIGIMMDRSTVNILTLMVFLFHDFKSSWFIKLTKKTYRLLEVSGELFDHLALSRLQSEDREGIECRAICLGLAKNDPY